MPFQVRSWPNVVLHLDGDAFFVSVLQAVNPRLKGKPIIAGSERGIATAMSYEAKKFGIHRAMRVSEARKLCPNLIVMNSDYELYSLFSQKMFEILRTFSPYVEEYSIDEAFADIKGLRRPLNMTYYEIGKAVKNKIEQSLGISISVGISLTKTLAKLASNSEKPSGLTIVNGLNIEKLLLNASVSDIWGIGENTGAYLNKLGIKTALELANKPEDFIKKNFNKSIVEIWHEIRGDKIHELDTSSKSSFKSMQSTQTFAPGTNDPQILWSKLIDHIEHSFTRARHLNYQIGKISIFLKTQDFKFHSTEVKFQTPVSYPMTVRNELKKAFYSIHRKGILYRATGCTILNLGEEKIQQQGLFQDQVVEERARKIYPLLENKKISFASSLYDKSQKQNQKQLSRLSIPVLELSS